MSCRTRSYVMCAVRAPSTTDHRSLCRVVSVLSFGAFMVVVGCRSEPPPELSLRPPVTAEVEVIDRGCRALAAEADLSSLDGRHRLIIATIDAVRDGRCEPVDAAARVCRSLFLIAATDPLVALAAGIDGDALDQLIERHRWALTEGTASAQSVGASRLVDAFEQLAGFDVDPDDVSLAATAVARASPQIIDPIAEAEAECDGVSD